MQVRPVPPSHPHEKTKWSVRSLMNLNERRRQRPTGPSNDASGLRQAEAVVPIGESWPVVGAEAEKARNFEGVNALSLGRLNLEKPAALPFLLSGIVQEINCFFLSHHAKNATNQHARKKKNTPSPTLEKEEYVEPSPSSKSKALCQLVASVPREIFGCQSESRVNAARTLSNPSFDDWTCPGVSKSNLTTRGPQPLVDGAIFRCCSGAHHVTVPKTTDEL
ncbi:hypothetical protein B0H63DRAFT_183173 [Podospora didyma]|uniref:Uncharacterized protein n=1 Tax=Podospora didyma TaxID=330526 RepID=A0AAE0NQ45_9PEZI|nr:hypothetical protein B0H63DRAFT_183173 [Podospora didyma]